MSKRDKTYWFMLANYVMIGVSFYQNYELYSLIGMIILAVLLYADTFLQKEDK